MGVRYEKWVPKQEAVFNSFPQIEETLLSRSKIDPDISLSYGDHGLLKVLAAVVNALKEGKKIALYADYDVDGTMSCVSWVWFFQAIAYHNYVYYIPDRFKEGYGTNLDAIKSLVHEKGAEVIITMDCGITANREAAWCRENGVQFICTDHHKINPETMPDCLILNPVMNPDEDYKYLCGCGITYVLLRKLGENFNCPKELWLDLLAIAGLATICDIVPLNSVNHKLAKLGVKALNQSKRPILAKLLESIGCESNGLDEQDIGFKLGPRINAVGRLDHGSKIVSAFIEEKSNDLVDYMKICNDERKSIQEKIWQEALVLAEAKVDQEIIFLGGDWHLGVLGIVASRLSEHFWKPVWLYSTSNSEKYKGSARSIPGFDVTEAMASCSSSFEKFGGHKAAGGFTFSPDKANEVNQRLLNFSRQKKAENNSLWVSSIEYDFSLSLDCINNELISILDRLKPFGHCFSEPKFLLEAPIHKVNFYYDKETGEKKHTCVIIKDNFGILLKILFFNSVYESLLNAPKAKFLVTVQKNHWRGRTSISLMGCDFQLN